MADPFLGEIKIFALNFAPRGWAFCNGQLLSLSQNTALFSLLGTFYGGDGRTTFGLPNLQGSAPLHQGQGDGLSAHQIGEAGGEAAVTLTGLNYLLTPMRRDVARFPASSLAPSTGLRCRPGRHLRRCIPMPLPMLL